jgi:hypothetical protein
MSFELEYELQSGGRVVAEAKKPQLNEHGLPERQRVVIQLELLRAFSSGTTTSGRKAQRYPSAGEGG